MIPKVITTKLDQESLNHPSPISNQTIAFMCQDDMEKYKEGMRSRNRAARLSNKKTRFKPVVLCVNPPGEIIGYSRN